MGKAALLGVAMVVAACAVDPGAHADGGESSGRESSDGASTSGGTSHGSTSGRDTTGVTLQEESTSDPMSSSAGDSTSGGAPSCPVPALGPGMHVDLQLEHGGLARTFDVFVPSVASEGGPVPLVVDMHGWGSSKEREAELSRLAEAAEARGYAVAYPAGFDASWNAGFCCGGAVDDEVDDVGFVVAMVERLIDEACIDRSLVYAAGFSNGAFMSYRLACEAAATFAAVAPVAGVMGTDVELCTPTEPLSVIHFHGTDDFNVAYDGRPWLGVPGPRDAMAHWAAHNGCAVDPVVTLELDDVTCETWPGCSNEAEVTLCSIAGGGHCWPGNPECAYGMSTTTISASSRMLDLFDMHAR